MTEYHDAAHEAYRRLLWARENRPDPEKIEALRKAEIVENRRRRLARFRASVA